VGGIPAIADAGILALDFFTADLLNGTKVYIRRFYSPSLLPEAQAADQHIHRSRCYLAPPPSAMRPWAPGLVHGRGRKNPRTGAVGAVTPTVPARILASNLAFQGFKRAADVRVATL
jgi:hypothetical protein